MASEGKYTDVYEKLARTTGCVKDFKRSEQGKLQEISFTEEDGEVEWDGEQLDTHRLIEDLRDDDSWTEVSMRSFVKTETDDEDEEEPLGDVVARDAAQTAKGCGIIIGLLGIIIGILFLLTPADDGPDPDSPEAKISSQFHPWDSRHLALEDLVVDNLNDPNSFDHLESRYTHNESEQTIRVRMEYTASNRLGGTVRGTAIAVFDYDGDVVDIIQLE